MFENNNKAVIRELAWENFRMHRSRNIMAVLAIFLTTVLITTVLTAGFSLIYTGSNASEQTPGPASDGYIVGGAEHYAHVAAMEQVEWADFVQKCSRVVLHNDIFSGIETHLLAPDEHFYRDNLVTLREGGYPQGANDVLISDTLAKRLGTEGKVGQPLTLEVVVGPIGQEEEQAIAMIICGVYHNPLYAISDIYDELYTSPDFIPMYNEAIAADDHLIYVKLNGLNPFLMKTDVTQVLSVIAAEVQAPGYSAGKNSGMFMSMVVAMLPVLLFVLMLMGSGYFLIYNVFYISIINDIRWFGLMKTIGATWKQLKDILNHQVHSLAIVGILLGVAVGYLLGLVISPRVLAMTDWSLYYQAPSFVWVALFAAVFALVTVKISAWKPLKLASSISPIEAQRFTPKGGKNVFTVVSLALSGIIFLAACNVSIGYQSEVIVDRYNQNDYQIAHKGAKWNQQEAYEPMAPGLANELRSLPFIRQVDVIYQARNHHDMDRWGYYPVSMGEVEAVGKLWQYYDAVGNLAAADDGVYAYTGRPMVNERRHLALGIAGLPAHRLATEAANYHLLDGWLDEEAFEQGDQLIFRKRNSQMARGQLSKEDDIHAGDVLTITFYDEAAQTSSTKELTVMAVVEAAHEYNSSDVWEADLILPDTLFQELYTDHEQMISGLQISAKEELTADEIEQILAILQSTHNNQLMTNSRYASRIQALRDQQTYGIIGFFLAGILAVIGISNVINTVTAHVLAHKLEYAAMQSVGMTRRQLGCLLAMDGMKYCAWALVIMMPLGGWVSYLLAQNALFTGFNGSLFAVSALAAAAMMLIISLALSFVLVKVLNKRSIVERLREIV